MKIALVVIGSVFLFFMMILGILTSVANGVAAQLPKPPTVTCDPFTDAQGHLLFCNPTFIPVP